MALFVSVMTTRVRKCIFDMVPDVMTRCVWLKNGTNFAVASIAECF